MRTLELKIWEAPSKMTKSCHIEDDAYVFSAPPPLLPSFPLHFFPFELESFVLIRIRTEFNNKSKRQPNKRIFYKFDKNYDKFGIIFITMVV